MKEENKEVVFMRSDPFALQQAFYDQQVLDYKRQIEFQADQFKQKMANTMIEAEATTEFNFCMARANQKTSTIVSIAKFLLWCGGLIMLYSIWMQIL